MRSIKGYIVIFAAVLMQACLGGIYAWSTFAAAAQKQFGYGSLATQTVFGTCVSVLTISFIFTGRLQDRFGPRRLALVSAILLMLGYAVSWLFGGYFIGLLLGWGLIIGLAIGCGYICPIATAVKWFPRHAGLVCGLAVAGYGLGAVSLSAVAEMLIARGWDLRHIFAVVGVIYGVIVLFCGSMMFLPPDYNTATVQPFKRRQLLGEKRFWQLFAAMFCGTLPGLTLLGSIRILGSSFGFDAAIAALAVVVAAVGNAVGRIIWGVICDRLGSDNAVRLLLSLIAVSSSAIIFSRANTMWFLVSVGFAGFCYGGNFAVYPAGIVKIFGATVLGSVYPMVFLGHGISATIGSIANGILVDVTGSFIPGLIMSLAVALAGLVIYVYLNRNERN